MVDMDSYVSRLGYVIGVDLGQSNDFTAVTIVERTREVLLDQPKPVSYAIRHLQRFKLATPYPDQVLMIGAIIKSLPPAPNKPVLVVDATGVGRPIVDLMAKAGLYPVAVTITAGANETSAGDFRYGIPKRNLVSCLQVAFQSGRLKIARGLPEAETLVNETHEF